MLGKSDDDGDDDDDDDDDNKEPIADPKVVDLE